MQGDTPLSTHGQFHFRRRGAHKFLDTLDFAYVYEKKYQYLSTDQALRNADSYAFAAASLFCGRLMCSDADIA